MFRFLQGPNTVWRLGFIAAVLAVLVVIIICGALASVAPYVVNFGVNTATPYIPITGTISEIAGMPIPADGVPSAQTIRAAGGTFDYSTALRPREVYNFY